MGSPSVLTAVQREQLLSKWSKSSGVDVDKLDVYQKGVVVAALAFLAFVGQVPALHRLVTYVLAHCGMGLSSTLIGAILGTTDRAVRQTRQYSPKEFWHRLQKAQRGRPAHKLQPEQVGPIARFLVENKQCSVAELLSFIEEQLGVRVDKVTLRRFMQRYGLGCLRGESVEGSPLLSEVQPTEGPWPSLTRRYASIT